MSIKTIVFDFGNVVGFFSHLRAAQQLARYSALSPEAICSKLFGAPLERSYDCGQIETPDFLGKLRQELDLTGSDAELSEAFADIFWPNEEVCALIPQLRGRVRLLLLSNTNDLHARQFGRQFADVLAHFSALVLSHEVRARKPDRAIYAACLMRAGCQPGECLLIDDLEINVQAARACGWQGLVYQPGQGLAERLLALTAGNGGHQEPESRAC